MWTSFSYLDSFVTEASEMLEAGKLQKVKVAAKAYVFLHCLSFCLSPILQESQNYIRFLISAN